ncbi:CHAT domain-containing protein [Mycena rosella]|uniref:CHAT domain-containing protein n=1 Tax=Mycena rosella TaxID=1033263 RepID=A0AAD7D8V4_MYCRO|nr:CHAT domain-containing protein [Mycena rosella]
MNDLDAWLLIRRKALDDIQQDDPRRPEALQNLAVFFGVRYQHLGDLQDLEDALQHFQEAVKLIPEAQIDRARCFRNLAVSFTLRYHKLGNLKDLEAAQNSHQAAVELIPELNFQNLAFRDRYQRLGDFKNPETALQNIQGVVDKMSVNNSERATHLHGLALILRDRYQRLEDLTDLEAALKISKEAVDMTPDGHPGKAGCLQHLAVSLRDRYQRLHDLKDLEAALQSYRMALQLTPADHPETVGHLQESSWKAALDWASFSEQFQPADGLLAYSAAFKILPEILWVGHCIPVRHDAIRRLDIGQVTSNATRTSITLSNLTSAVEILEQGLATTFQQMFQLKTDGDNLHPEQGKTLRKLSYELYSGKSSNLRNIADERHSLLESIRRQSGLESFLLPKRYTVLRYASQRGPVVILNSHKEHCDGILILNQTSYPVHVPLSHVTLEMLHFQKGTLQELLSRCNVRSRGESESSRLFGHQECFTSKSPDECFKDLLAWLWDKIVSPVYQVLESHGIHNGRLWWLATGAFTGFPLHASPPTDQFIHSYTTTLGSLLDSYAKKSPSTSKFGIVGVTHTDIHGRDFLKGVGQEVSKICSIIKGPIVVLNGEQATVDAVQVQLQDCSWIHLACHGKQDLGDPTKSYLKLYGGSLELDTILRMPLLNAEFVFLAACQTAMGDAELVNEAVHLTGGFIAAGFRSAIGTLWSMNDQDGPLVAEIVYSHLFRNGRQPKASNSAEALHFAVKELKARKVSCERWIPFIHMGL